jgi:isoamylase
VDAFGQPLRDDAFLLLLNPHHETITFCLPPPHPDMSWELCFDTRDEDATTPRLFEGNTPYELSDRCFALLKEKAKDPGNTPA